MAESTLPYCAPAFHKNIIIFIMGGPGAGKTTIGHALQDNLEREFVLLTEWQRGMGISRIPTAHVVSELEKEIDAHRERGYRCFIVDGFPTSMVEYRALIPFISNHHGVWISLDCGTSNMFHRYMGLSSSPAVSVALPENGPDVEGQTVVGNDSADGSCQEAEATSKKRPSINYTQLAKYGRRIEHYNRQTVALINHLVVHKNVIKLKVDDKVDEIVPSLIELLKGRLNVIDSIRT